MINSLQRKLAGAAGVIAMLVLPSALLGQTGFSFNIIQNDGVNFKVQVEVTTSTSPNTLGSSTIDIEFDQSVLDYVNVDGAAGALRVHNNTWIAGCLAATGNDFAGCGASIPYSISGNALNDGTDYIRVTILPNTTTPIGTLSNTTPGVLVDGYEVPGSATGLFQLNFTFDAPEQGGTLSKTMAPEDLTFRTNTLSFGYFELLDNIPETGSCSDADPDPSCGVIIDDCSETLGNGCSVENSVGLPVEFVDFTALVDNGDVLLNWATASETDNAGFSVEHATGETESFEEIAFVDGAGTSLEARTYTYTVKGLDVGTHRFRLKQLDYDGSFEFSSVVETSIELAGTHRLGAAYPNPFNPSTTFELVVGREQRVQIDIVNALGQRVERLFDGTMEANKPTNFTFEAGNLPTGLYFYRAVGENFAQTRQALLVK